MSSSEDEFLDGDIEVMEATFDRSLGGLAWPGLPRYQGTRSENSTILNALNLKSYILIFTVKSKDILIFTMKIKIKDI